MSDWTEELAQAEEHAEQLQAAEATAEQHFYELREAERDRSALLQTPEFERWMKARHATDAAWGAWAQVMDAKPHG